MSEEEIIEEEVAIDLDEIAKKYEDKGFFRRLGDMFTGLGKPHDTREYKLARIELQRLSAPLVAIIVPILFGVVLCVVTMISGQKKDKIEVNIASVEEETEELKEEEEIPPDDIEPPPMEEVEITVDTPNPNPVATVTPVPTPPSTQVSVKPATMDSVAIVKSPVTMKSMTGSRTPGSIGAATRGGAGYGDAITEATVMKVLWWLKAHQNTDGSWGKGNKIANTGFAILTYLAHGEYPGSPSPYKRDFGPTVQMAIDYLISNIYTDKAGTPRFRGSDGNEYSFLIATYALCEAYGMTKNPNCKEAAHQCLTRIVQNQASTGGWDYKINKSSTRDDLSFMGWAIQALKAGKMAGLHPEGLQTAINKAINCLKKRNYSKSGGFTYTPKPHNNGGSTGLAGVGTLAMQLLGRGGEPESLNALEVMRDWKPTFDPDQLSAKKPGGCPQYYCYYATQCKYQAGMKAGAPKNDEITWQNWNVAMKKLYPSLIKDLPEKVADHTGKEHKQGYFENKDAHSTRPYMDTCLAALQLMVYYRYLPTTSVKAGEDDAGAGGDAAQAIDKSKDVAVTVDI
jgi:hypothetical protein